MNNFWGEPDDSEPLPDWMNPATYRNGNTMKPRGRSLTDVIMDAAKKPPIDLSYLNKQPNIGDESGGHSIPPEEKG